MTLSYWDTWHNIIIIKNIISIFLLHLCYQAVLSNSLVQEYLFLVSDGDFQDKRMFWLMQ